MMISPPLLMVILESSRGLSPTLEQLLKAYLSVQSQSALSLLRLDTMLSARSLKSLTDSLESSVKDES
jgi:hypothetical protein